MSAPDEHITASRRMTLPRGPSTALLARAIVADLVPESSPSFLRDAQLIVSELASNALRHGTGRIRLHLALASDGRLSGEVVDGGKGFQLPSPQAAAGKRSGWGLRIVDELAERWGIATGSTRVWFEMPAEGSP